MFLSFTLFCHLIYNAQNLSSDEWISEVRLNSSHIDYIRAHCVYVCLSAMEMYRHINNKPTINNNNNTNDNQTVSKLTGDLSYVVHTMHHQHVNSI